jgi:hypothetical protein
MFKIFAKKTICINLFFLKKLILLFIGICLFSITIHSQNFDTQLNLQDSTQKHTIILKNGKKAKGIIIKIQNEKIFFEKKKKKENITLTIAEIQEIKVRGHLPWNKKNTLDRFNIVNIFSTKILVSASKRGKEIIALLWTLRYFWIMVRPMVFQLGWVTVSHYCYK